MKPKPNYSESIVCLVCGKGHTEDMRCSECKPKRKPNKLTGMRAIIEDITMEEAIEDAYNTVRKHKDYKTLNQFRNLMITITGNIHIIQMKFNLEKVRLKKEGYSKGREDTLDSVYEMFDKWLSKQRGEITQRFVKEVDLILFVRKEFEKELKKQGGRRG